jgi:hypothetical protein
LFINSPDAICSLHPYDTDPVYNYFKEMSSLSSLFACKKYDKINYKLKSRIFIEDKNFVEARCADCNSILTSVIAPKNSVGVIESYSPEDRQSMMVQYCEILKQVDNIAMTDSINEFLDKTYANAKRSQQFELAEKMLSFLNRIELEITNI